MILEDAAAHTPIEEFVWEDRRMSGDPSTSWADLERLQEWTNLPILIKGGSSHSVYSHLLPPGAANGGGARR